MDIGLWVSFGTDHQDYKDQDDTTEGTDDHSLAA